MENNQAFLLDAFNIYYNQAEDAKNAGNTAMQKKKLLQASETLLKLAKMSKGEVRKARLERAERLFELANNLGGEKTRESGAPTMQKQKAKNESKNNKDDEDGTIWQEAKIPDIKFSDVAGLEEVKQAVNTRIILPRKHKDLYEHYKKKIGGGILMYGPPGTGKSMIAKAIAAEVGAKFYSVKCSDIVSKWFGEAERNIKSLFETARQDSEAVIFFDEFESLGAKRGGNSSVMSRIIPELLSQIQGFSEENSTLLLLAATNRPWDLDTAFLRPGRFNELLYIPLPDFEARRYMLGKAFSGIRLCEDLDLDEIAGLTDGYSGADIAELCERTKDEPIQKVIKSGGHEFPPITQEDLQNALRKVKSSVAASDLAALKKFRESFNQL